MVAVEDDSGTLILTEELNDALSAITWTARIEGIKAPIPALRGDHAVVIQTRARAGAWATFLIDSRARSRSATTTAANDNGSLRSSQSPAYSTTTRRRASRSARENIVRFGDASTDTELADWRGSARRRVYQQRA